MGKRSVVFVALLVAAATLAGCSSRSAGDARACEIFSDSQSRYEEALTAVQGEGDDVSESTRANYRETLTNHAEALRSAAREADSNSMARDFDEMAALWEQSTSDDDSGVAYFLMEADMEEAC